MYGSQFHFQATQLQKSEVTQAKFSFPKINFKNFTLISILIISTKLSFAGSKEPKLAGGNGNATGRSR